MSNPIYKAFEVGVREALKVFQGKNVAKSAESVMKAASKAAKAAAKTR